MELKHGTAPENDRILVHRESDGRRAEKLNVLILAAIRLLQGCKIVDLCRTSFLSHQEVTPHPPDTVR